ncbi:MAG TPA: hypothetical protein VL049_27885 [Candidatus Dormibacteraeota bacterium]|nr:hypothetical protein [Candidatus Dormibacteraeota bacterium]
MMAIDTASERIGSPAPSYAAHRQRAVAASFAAGIVVILALIRCSNTPRRR